MEAFLHYKTGIKRGVFFLFFILCFFKGKDGCAQVCGIADVRIVNDTITCVGWVDIEVDLAIPNNAAAGDSFSLSINPANQGGYEIGSFQVLTPTGQVIANVTISTNRKVATFTLTNYVDNNTSIFATIHLDMWMSGSLKQLYDQTLTFSFTDSCGNTYTDPLFITACNPWNPNYSIKNGAWTRTDQGQTNPNHAINWWFYIPEGPYTKATITDTGGPGFDFDCSSLHVRVNTSTNGIGQPTGWTAANLANYNIVYCNANGFEVEVLNAAPGEVYTVTIHSDLTDGGTQSEYPNSADFDVDGVQWTKAKTVKRSSGNGSGSIYELDFQKTADVSTYDQAGDVINYSFTVTNNGDKTLNNIGITDPLLGTTIACTPNTLAPGDSATCGPASYTVTQADINSGKIINTATFSAQDENGSPITKTTQHTVTAIQNPETALVKKGTYVDTNNNGTTDPGDKIEYVFTITNTGNVSLSNATFDDALLNITNQTFPDTLLAPGENSLFTYSYSITQNDIDQGKVINQAIAQAEDPNGNTIGDDSGTAVDNDGKTVTTLAQNPEMALVKTGTLIDTNNDGITNPGDEIQYTFTLTNTGNVTLDNAVFDDTLLNITNQAFTPGIIAPGNSSTFTASYILTQADIDHGEIVNQATAQGEDPNGKLVNDISGTAMDNDNPTITPIPQNPKMALVKTGSFNDENGDNIAQVGETIVYTFTVNNIGNVTLDNLSFNDSLLNLNLQAFTPNNLPPGGSTSYSATYGITQADIDQGKVSNQAIAQGRGPNENPVDDTSGTAMDNNTLTVTLLPQNPALNLVKTGVFNDENGDSLTQAGETITYTFTVTNTGNVTIDNLVIDDAVIGLSNLSITPNTLAPGETGTVAYQYDVNQPDIDAGEIVNQASVMGSYPNGNVDVLSGTSESNTDPTITPLPQYPSINLIKTGEFNDDNGNGFSEVGETITYTFTVINDGNVTLNTISINDIYINLNGLSLPSAILAPEEIGVVTYHYAITQTDIDNGGIINQATATAIDSNGNTVEDNTSSNSLDTPYNDKVTETLLPPEAQPSIQLIKTSAFNDDNGNGFSEVGETITYHFTVTNTGNAPLEDITVTDPLPGLFIMGGPINLLPGETDNTAFTATYSITEADIIAEKVINQAKVIAHFYPDTEISTLSDNGESTNDETRPTITKLVRDCRLIFYNAISSVQNGLNKRLYIKNIECFPDNTIEIYNRWGVKVFYTRGYDNETRVFTGYAEGMGVSLNPGKMLPTGTYFYVLKYKTSTGDSKDQSGYLYIK